MITDKDSFVFAFSLGSLERFGEVSNDIKSLKPKDLVDITFKQLIQDALDGELGERDDFPPDQFKQALFDYQFFESRTSLQPANGNYVRASFATLKEKYQLELSLPQTNRLHIDLVLDEKLKDGVSEALALEIYRELLRIFLSEPMLRAKMKEGKKYSVRDLDSHFKHKSIPADEDKVIELIGEAFDEDDRPPKRIFNALLIYVDFGDKKEAFCFLNSKAAKKLQKINQTLVLHALGIKDELKSKFRFLEIIFSLAKPKSFDKSQEIELPPERTDAGELTDSIGPNEIFYGPPGSGKTMKAMEEAKDSGFRVTSIQFHPSYSYEHFVQGERLISLGAERTTQVIDGHLMVVYRRVRNSAVRTKCIIEKGDGGKIKVVFPSGILAIYEVEKVDKLLINFKGTDTDTDFISPVEIAGPIATVVASEELNQIASGQIVEVKIKSKEWSKRRPEVMVIDEINRADSARVFGELLMALGDHNGGRSPRLQYSGEEFHWPKNLRILATMNSADRSIGEIDQAMKRRFKLREIESDPKLLAKAFPRDYRIKLEKYLRNSNDTAEIEKTLGISIEKACESDDGVVELFNLASIHHGGKQTDLIPIPSKSLENLHKVLRESPESAFSVNRKLVGHSFHMKFVKDLSEKLEVEGGIGFPLAPEVWTSLGAEVSSMYKDFKKQEIQPQIESIFLENDKAVRSAIKKWEESDAKDLTQFSKVDAGQKQTGTQ